MEVSRLLARNNPLGAQPHGAVIAADFQEAGRGRIRERRWEMENGIDLAFTVLLRFAAIPTALGLRAGLALALAIEDFAPALSGKALIKWPNDILLPAPSSDGELAALKTAGILAEAESGIVYIGMGVNLSQSPFPNGKTTSIGLASGAEYKAADRFILLEKILSRLRDEIEPVGDAAAGGADWRERLEARLYKKGERICFAKGAADSGDTVEGTLEGIGPEGELLILPPGETAPLSFTAGELLFFR